MTKAEYQRQYYELRKTRGCFDCGKHKQPNSTRCHQCARDHAAKAKELYYFGKVNDMKSESKAHGSAQNKITSDKPKKAKREKITSNKATEEMLNKAAVERGLGVTKKTHSHKAAREVFLRVNQLSEKFVSPFGLGLEEL